LHAPTALTPQRQEISFGNHPKLSQPQPNPEREMSSGAFVTTMRAMKPQSLRAMFAE
jgi:hypothetical protein